MWITRYWISSWLMSAALAVCPNRRYANEVSEALQDLNARVAAEVEAQSRG